MMENWILLVAVVLLLCAIALFLYDRMIMRKTIKGLSALLDRAISEDMGQITFDESLHSALEAKLAKFLAKNALSATQIKKERDKIKELIGDISHQTKTPIANILLYAQLMGEQDIPPDCQQQLQLLISQSEKLHFLIHSLVDLSRLETGIISVNPKQDSIRILLETVEENIAPKANAQNITLLLPHTQEQAVFDRKWTAEALYNIADNAVKYTPEGGCIQFQVTSYEMFCRIDITDNGMGIAKEELSKIFGRFYRSPSVSNQEGVGIGLFLAREIVSAEKGYIKVSSKPGAGTTFSIFLPIGQGAEIQ